MLAWKRLRASFVNAIVVSTVVYSACICGRTDTNAAPPRAIHSPQFQPRPVVNTENPSGLPTAHVSTMTMSLWLGLVSQYAEDTSRTWTVAEMLRGTLNDGTSIDKLFKTVPHETPNFGVTESAYWFRMRLCNVDTTALRRLLVVEDYFIQNIVVAVRRSAGSAANHAIETHLGGTDVAFNAREVRTRFHAFPIAFAPCDTLEIYIRCTCELTMSVPTRLWAEEEFVYVDGLNQIPVWLYFGVVAAMLFYNLFLYLTLRDTSYLLYVLYSFSVGAFMFWGNNGLAFQFVPLPQWLQYRVICSTGLGAIFFQLLFTIHFLRTKISMPRFHLVLVVWCGVNGVFSAAALVLPPMVSNTYGNVVVGIAVVLSYAAAVMALRRNHRSAILFMLGWTTFVIGTVLFTLNNEGLLHFSNIAQYMAQVGSALEMILFSMALADRINTIKREKAQAQKEALRSSELLIETLKESERELEYKVKERTQQLEQSNIQLILTHDEVQSQIQKVSMQSDALHRAYSQLQAVNEQLQQTNADLDEANRFKTEMLSVASHDLKSPLSVILGMSERLTSMIAEQTPERTAEFQIIDQIYASVHRMSQLIHDLLDSAALELGHLQLEYTEFLLPELVAELVLVYGEYAKRKHQSVVTQYPDAGDAEGYRVRGDRKRLFQVVENILSNALKYSPHGATIMVGMRSEKTTVRLWVEDEGPGLTTHDKERLFKRFQRLSAQPTGEESSTGIGLSIAKDIVELHGGRIWCESVAGSGLVGAMFAIELPRDLD